MNKKAQMNTILETANGFKVMFGFILVVVIVSAVLISFHDNAIQQEEFQTAAITPTMEKLEQYPVFMDWAALLLYGIAFVASMWLLYMVDAQPILYLVSWISMIALSVAIIGAGYALEQIMNTELLADAVANMIFIPFYASNAFLFALVYFFGCAIALHTPRE